LCELRFDLTVGRYIAPVPPTDIPLNPMVLTPDGSVISRSYQLIEELGRGAAGMVWRARATATGREYAIKILHDDGRQAPKAVARFLQERGILLRLRHENLVAVHDLLTTADGRLALVLDLVTGGTLRELLRQRNTLPPAFAADLLAQIAGGLAAAHAKGVVHRDLKPDNILLAPTLDGGVRARLTDFGIARLLDSSGMTTSGAVLGTPNYMAPEVIEGAPATPAADVYALGIILYELLAGRPPFDDDGCDTAILLRHTQAAARPQAGMPPRIWALIEACLSRDPSQRPAAETLRTTLRRLALETAGIAALPAAPGQQTFLLAKSGDEEAKRRSSAGRRPAKAPAPRPRPPRSRRVTTALVAVAVVVLLTGGLVGTRMSADRDRDGAAPPAEAPGGMPTAGGVAGTGTSPSAGPARPAAGASGSPAPMPSDAAQVSVAASPSPSRPVAPIGEAPEDFYGDWICTEARWPIGHPMVAEACHAIGDKIKIQGVFSGISGVNASLEVSLENEGGDTVAGPFPCANRTFTDETQEHVCGPRIVDPPRGRYKVVGKWVYPKVDDLTPPGSVVGNPFDW
jgi:serine/threonine-protein kinase